MKYFYAKINMKGSKQVKKLQLNNEDDEWTKNIGKIHVTVVSFFEEQLKANEEYKTSEEL